MGHKKELSFVSNTVKNPQIVMAFSLLDLTGRPASADRTAHLQFQATCQPVSPTKASDEMTSQLLR